jgi:hypothetical protein
VRRTLTTRSPAANSACSKRRETCRQSSIAHTRISSKPRAQRTAARCPASSALIPRWPRILPVPSSTAASVCDPLCVSAPITIIDRPFVWLNTDEADHRRTTVTRGESQASIK